MGGTTLVNKNGKSSCHSKDFKICGQCFLLMRYFEIDDMRDGKRMWGNNDAKRTTIAYTKAGTSWQISKQGRGDVYDNHVQSDLNDYPTQGGWYEWNVTINYISFSQKQKQKKKYNNLA
jgi:hypothetical protein